MNAVVDNRRIVFDAPESVREVLDDRTAFRVPGFQFSDAYKDGYWDGKEHLVKKFRGRPGWFEMPAGLFDELVKVTRAQEVELAVHDQRRRPASTIDVRWNDDFELRPYQVLAVEEALKDRGLATGKGMLDVPTRGGKTVIAAGIINRLRHTTLFLVNSEMLYRQTVELFKKVLGVKIGKIGKGIWDPGPITVASLQTLVRRVNDEEFEQLASSVDVVIFDECHHCNGDKFREIIEKIDAYYKFGISATIFLHAKQETPKGTIWLRGACGPVLYKITPSELVDLGFLVPPEVTIHTVVGPPVDDDVDYRAAYEAGIVRHDARNTAIVDLAKRRHEEGLQVVITVRELAHVGILDDALQARGLRVGMIVGETPSKERAEIVRDFTNREIDVLLGTVFGEAVDIPAISSVIVADGGKSKIAATQRFRNLTPAPGKDRAVLDDFDDLHNRILASHSSGRIATYRSHQAFTVRDGDRIGG